MALACPRRPFLPARLPPITNALTAILQSPRQPQVHMAVGGILLGATAAAAGIILGQLTSSGSSKAPCEKCDGRGYIPCLLCTRWSYRESSESSASSHLAARHDCASCHGSQRTECPRCRGGGTVVPTLERVRIPVRVDDGLDSMRRFVGVVFGVVLQKGLRRSRRAGRPCFDTAGHGLVST